MTEQEKLREEAEKHLYQGYGISNEGGDDFHDEIWNDWLNSMISFHKSQLEEHIKWFLNSLGYPENEYLIRHIDGEWWIYHNYVGSGEPLAQALKSKLTNKEEK